MNVDKPVRAVYHKFLLGVSLVGGRLYAQAPQTKFLQMIGVTATEDLKGQISVGQSFRATVQIKDDIDTARYLSFYAAVGGRGWFSSPGWSCTHDMESNNAGTKVLSTNRRIITGNRFRPELAFCENQRTENTGVEIREWSYYATPNRDSLLLPPTPEKWRDPPGTAVWGSVRLYSDGNINGELFVSWGATRQEVQTVLNLSGVLRYQGVQEFVARLEDAVLPPAGPCCLDAQIPH